MLTGAGISMGSASPIRGRTDCGPGTLLPSARRISTSTSATRRCGANWAQRAEDLCGRTLIPTRSSGARQLERREKLHTLITQNVDELHQRRVPLPVGSSRSTAPPARSLVSNVTIATTWRSCLTGSGRVRPTRRARPAAGFSNPPRSVRSEPDCRGSSAGRTSRSGVRSLPRRRDLARGVPDQRDDQGCAPDRLEADHPQR